MGLLARIGQLVRRFRSQDVRRQEHDEFRRCRFETMEPRRLMDADPIRIGATYLEGDSGADHHGDTFQITFVGGAPGTQLTQVVIDGDEDPAGFGKSDSFFDSQEGGLGADHGSPFTIVSLQTKNPQASVVASVLDGTSSLTLDFTGFQAGDKLVFTIDVDEVEDFDPTVTDLDAINDGFDPITSGVEFQGARLTAQFSAPHYYGSEGTGVFLNKYDGTLAGSGLDLPADDFDGKRDRSDGAMVELTQAPLPISISGQVYLEKNLDLVQNSNEPGINNVELTLWKKQGDAYASTGLTTRTDSTGRYEFGTNLKLLPGTYQVRETQPAGLFSVGAIPGTVEGTLSGATVVGNKDFLTEISIPLGGQQSIDNDFAEAEPAQISGYVYHDRSDDGSRDSGEEGLSGVTVQVIPVSTIAPQSPVTVQTDGNGHYQVTGLSPGSYRIVQPTQPSTHFDGRDTPGKVNGLTVGTVSNPGDSLEQIVLAGGQVGVEYNFGELLPASLTGRVGLTDKDGNCDGVQFRAVSDAVVRLLDSSGKQVAETKTNGDGVYEFTGLRPGQYSVVELTPTGLIDGDSRAGKVSGLVMGQSGLGTIASIVLGSGRRGVEYDFCEHEPSSISGFVYHDQNDNGMQDSGESPIGEAVVTLRDAKGETLATQRTDSNGFYQFVGLSAGVYSVVETQPTGWLDGRDAAGKIDGRTAGQATNPGDKINGVALRWGEQSTRNDFGELLPGSISGQVHLDKNGNCELDDDEETLAGVTIQLLGSDGKVLQTTETDDDGRYQFTGLTPGTYGVRELQPDGVYQGGQEAGSHGGDDFIEDLITNIQVGSGQFLVHYDFCELPPASLAGMVFSDPNGDCEFNEGDSELAGVTVQLLNDRDEVFATTKTDGNGRYKFENLAPGVYSVRELQPAGYFHGGQTAGDAGGNTFQDDLIGSIFVTAGENLVGYDFCEVPPASLAGMVFVDPNRDCEFNDGDSTLAGVTVQLLNDQDEIVAATTTDSQGHYKFEGLAPGIYSVRELQPDGYFQGGQTAGSNGGDVLAGDVIGHILVSGGDELVDYNFCEVPPATLAGMVFVDPNRDCEFGTGDTALAGVTVELLDSQGEVVATQRTDSHGKYKFEHLAPSTYSVRQTQPNDYFSGGETVGSGGGVTSTTNLIASILVAGGDDLVNYDFCEVPAARIAGNVFRDGAPIQNGGQELSPLQIGLLRDGKFTSDDTPLPGVTLQLRDGFTGRPIDASEALPGRYAAGPVQVKTDAKGHYEFVGIQGGRSYAVYEVHPAGFVDGIDTVGTTTGFAFNAQSLQGEFVLEPLAEQPASDAIIRIAVAPGGVSENNNFSEVTLLVTQNIPPLSPPPLIVFPPPQTFIPQILPTNATNSARQEPILSTISWVAPRQNVMTETIAGSIGYTWHLSVVNGGMPRDIASASKTDDAVWRSATHLDQSKWVAEDMDQARWVLAVTPDANQRQTSRTYIFGIRGGIPFTGDFNGDGTSEIGIFYRGEWFVDLNGNGVWDEADLWAKLGDELDRPVVGDWDGDGKDDIGIHGPEWFGDQRQLVRERGLPDSQNLQHAEGTNQPKNVPPTQDNATDGQRLLRLNVQGPRRADVIDHVLRYGDESDTPVAGDWNGDGIRTVGVFRGGKWRIDVDGDGLAEDGDAGFHFGAVGDIPVVGDWDGNGVEEIGIYRSGKWILDVNGNRELDAHDKVFEMGGAADRPVVGDWNGDGIDEPGVYREVPSVGEIPVKS